MFSVAVKIEGLEKRRRTTNVVHALLGFFLLIKSADLYNIQPDGGLFRVLPFLVVGTASVLYALLRKRYDPLAQYNAPFRITQTMVFFLFGVIMLRAGKTLDGCTLFGWSALSWLLFFSEKKLFAATYLTITEAGIRIPGTYREHLVEWAELESVTLRHDFITLFHRGKKYLQYQVMQDLSELEVVKMNALAKEQLEKHSATSASKTT